jgi:hypothetical protein
LSACLLSLSDERLDELQDELLLSLGQLLSELEGFLKLACGARLSDGVDGSVTEELFDADGEHLGHLGQDVGARRLVGELPEGDRLLLNADGLGELGLAQACGTPEGGDARTLLGTRLGERTTHPARIRVDLERTVLGHRFGLAQ